jgi:UDP-glucose 4-epimerase
MFPSIDRVYVNERARNELGWLPRYDFAAVVDRLKEGDDVRSPLAQLVGSKGYHAEVFSDGPFPVESSVIPRQAPAKG